MRIRREAEESESAGDSITTTKVPPTTHSPASASPPLLLKPNNAQLASGMRDTLISSALVLMDGLADLSTELMSRVRNSAAGYFSAQAQAQATTRPLRPPTKTVVTFVPLSSNDSSSNVSSSSRSEIRQTPSRPTPLLPLSAEAEVVRNMTETRKKLTKQATAFVRTILKDISKSMNKRLQNS
jgi:hypothetical protein